MKEKNIKNISNDYTVNANNTNYICKPRGKFKYDKLILAVIESVSGFLCPNIKVFLLILIPSFYSKIIT